MAPKIFIDGEHGTTGLQIQARLKGRSDLELLSLPHEDRRDDKLRREMLNEADLVVLCLPDDAAREAVAMIDNDTTRVIDASTAHRITEGWTYGFPEYDTGQTEAIASSKRVSNPGCYALTAVSMIHPLVKRGLLASETPVTINAISGYSGGGKAMIAEFEDKTVDNYTQTPFRLYALSLEHKHLPEIQKWGGLSKRPLFVPSVGRYHKGMLVQMPLQLEQLPGQPTLGDLHDALSDHYRDCRFVSIAPIEETEATNHLRLHVFGNDKHGHAVVVGLLDNLGKGASGQAVQNLNIMLGLEEASGLI